MVVLLRCVVCLLRCSFRLCWLCSFFVCVVHAQFLVCLMACGGTDVFSLVCGQCSVFLRIAFVADLCCLLFVLHCCLVCIAFVLRYSFLFCVA